MRQNLALKSRIDHFFHLDLTTVRISLRNITFAELANRIKLYRFRN